MSTGAEQQVSDDGWTNVGRKKGTRKTSLKVRNGPEYDKNVTVKTITADFERKMKTWQNSSSRSNIHKFLNREAPDDGWDIAKAVVLGTGSFCMDNFDCRRRTMTQFVMFIDLVRYLQASTNTQIQILAQEPWYTAVDMQFLSTVGAEVLGTSLKEVQEHGIHLALDHFGPQTWVCELCIEMGSKQIEQLCDANFRLYLGTMSGRLDGPRLQTAEKWGRDLETGDMHHIVISGVDKHHLIAQFVKDHRSLKFPYFEEDPTVFETLVFHWKEPKDSDNDEEGTTDAANEVADECMSMIKTYYEEQSQHRMGSIG